MQVNHFGVVIPFDEIIRFPLTYFQIIESQYKRHWIQRNTPHKLISLTNQTKGFQTILTHFNQPNPKS